MLDMAHLRIFGALPVWFVNKQCIALSEQKGYNLKRIKRLGNRYKNLGQNNNLHNGLSFNNSIFQYRVLSFRLEELVLENISFYSQIVLRNLTYKFNARKVFDEYNFY